MNFALFGIIALLVVELSIAGACALLYARMRSKADAQQASLTPWGIEVKAAMGTAQAASQKVDMIELEHFKNLRSLFESQVLQIAKLEGEIKTLKIEIEQLQTKVLTLQRLERGARAKTSAAAAAASPGPVSDVDDENDDPMRAAIANGVAIPLNRSGAANPSERPRSTFGKIP